MTTRAVEEVDEWNSTPFSGGYRGLHDLADDEFSGVVRAGRPKLCMLNGTVVGILDGDIEDFEDTSGTAYRAPSPALPLLALMQERNDEVRAKYYTEDTPISDVDTTLSDGNFTGYIELSENVLSGDYYVVYHEGRRMAVAFVGNTGQLLTEDDAFERADGEVGIYQVRPAEVAPVEIPEVEESDPEPDSAGPAGAAAGAGATTGAGAAAESDSGTEAETTGSQADSARTGAPGAADATEPTESEPTESSTDRATSASAEATSTDRDSSDGAESGSAGQSSGPADRSSGAADRSSGTTGGPSETTAATDTTTGTESGSGSGAGTAEPDGEPSTTGPDSRDRDSTDREPDSRTRRDSRPDERSNPPRDTGRSESSSRRSESSSRQSGSTDRAGQSDRSTTDRPERSPSQGNRQSDQPESNRAGQSAPSESRSGGEPAGRDSTTGRTDAGPGPGGGRATGSGTGAPNGNDGASAPGGAGSAGSAAGGSASGGSADDLETRSIPSLDPAQTGPSDDTGGATALGGGVTSRDTAPDPAPQSDPRSPGGEPETGRATGSSARSEPTGTAQSERAGQTDATRTGESTPAPRDAGSSRQGRSAQSRDRPAEPADRGQPEPAGRGDAPDSAGTAGEDVDARIAELEAELEDREIEIERLDGDLADAEAEADDLRSTLEDVRSERDDLRSQIDALESERDRLREERDDLQSDVERLESELEELESEVEEIESEFGAAVGADRRMSAGEALDQTNLFVRYESKGQATLESAHSGNASRQEVGDNLGLEYHTQFETDAVSVGGRSFDEFLRSTSQYRFVTWVINDLLYEIRDTGKTAALQELYDAIPRIDRAELNGSINAEYTEDGQERRTQESFDVVVRDRMGNPLMVANLNDSRQAASESMMSALVTASSHVGESTDSLAASFLVTSSFFEPEALETAADATSGGILNRDKRESFVKLARKRGYHLCLVEAREDKFHLAVPEL